jgi:phosphatidylglycerophosphatase A
VKRRIPLLLASGFYIGLIPGAPGSYASAATTIVFYLVHRSFGRIDPALHLSVLCAVTLVGVLSAAAVARAKGDDDPGIVVIDEIAGQLLTFLFVPVTVLTLVLGTAFFRLFDIFKPYPIRKLEHLPGGVGIMADDLLAGVYANLLLQAAARFVLR